MYAWMLPANQCSVAHTFVCTAGREAPCQARPIGSLAKPGSASRDSQDGACADARRDSGAKLFAKTMAKKYKKMANVFAKILTNTLQLLTKLFAKRLANKLANIFAKTIREQTNENICETISEHK